MAIEDIIVEDGRCVYRPILAEAGDTLTCPKGHAVADIVKDIRLGDRTLPVLFANWRGREGWTPSLGDPAAGIQPDSLPLCPVCDGNPWRGPQDDFRPRTQRGFRCLPGDPGDEGPCMIRDDTPPETRPDVQAAIAEVGYGARPTGRLRLLQTGHAARLQQEWRGECGTVWLNVPVVHVAELPPRWIEAAPSPDASAGSAGSGEGAS